MRRTLSGGAVVVLLAGPVVLAFFSGGFFDESRSWAGLVAWTLVLLAALLTPHVIPLTAPARVLLGGLAGLAVWTLLSMLWAPIVGSAYHLGQVAMLYLGGLVAGSALLRGATVRVAEVAVAAGAVIVIGYGLSERLLPGLLHFSRSLSAYGRLEQPLTYWNAMGELAAIGLVVCLRLAGDVTRDLRLRLVATAAAAPLGIGLYISFSRGALFACFAGIVTLIVVAPRREAWRSGAVALIVAVVAAAVTAPLSAFTSLTGSHGAAVREGAIAFALLAVIMAIGALVQRQLVRREVPARVRLARGVPSAALVVVGIGLAVAIVAGAKEKSRHPLGTGAARFATLQSNRYDYWRVALRAFGDQPLRGVGAGGWAVYWLRYRTIREGAADAHSLPLQTLAELGLVGAALLGCFVVGGVWVARRALDHAPVLAAGPTAGVVVYLAHSPLDWDWEMPALTLSALVLLAVLVALSDTRPAATEDPASAARGQVAIGA